MPESYDSLKNLPRVPHAEGTVMTGRQIGVGGNPPDKMYISYGEAVDLKVAAARLAARQRGELEKIPGGIDDEDERLYHKPKALSPFAKMQVAQGRALTEDDVARIKSQPQPQKSGTEVKVGPVSSGPRAAKNAETQSPGSLVLSYPDAPRQVGGRREGLLPSMGGPAGSVDDEQQQFVASVEIRPGVVVDKPVGPGPMPMMQQPPQVVYVDRPVEKVVEKVVEVPADTEASKWLKQRVRVQIATDSMTFNVSAIAVVRAIHAVTVILPSSNDAMTFVPKAGTKIQLQSKDTGVLNTVFTGASFDIPELGILGLAFLIPKPEPSA